MSGAQKFRVVVPSSLPPLSGQIQQLVQAKINRTIGVQVAPGDYCWHETEIKKLTSINQEAVKLFDAIRNARERLPKVVNAENSREYDLNNPESCVSVIINSHRNSIILFGQSARSVQTIENMATGDLA